MLNKALKFFSKFFLFPIIVTSVHCRHQDLNTFKDIAITFCITFTLNWFLAMTVWEWNFKRAEEFNRKKKERQQREKQEKENKKEETK